MRVPGTELSTVTNEEEFGVSCVCFGRVGEGDGCEFGFLFFIFFFPASEQEGIRGKRGGGGMYCKDKICHGEKCLVC